MGAEDEGWDDVLNQHLLNNLSDEDSRWFLEQVPIEDEDIISKIVFHSRGVPLFLDMSVDLYQDDINNNRIPDFSKIKHREKLIDRYMNYLDIGSRNAIKILSIPDSITELTLNSFGNCTALEELTIGSSDNLINFGAFSNCYNLKNIYYKGTRQQWSAVALLDEEAQKYFNNATMHFAE
ncbi:MAG: leucine-rich repeat protein [Clostridia bacterium]|nr:leucine-rich repeat protein [Clostridia bacterium]